VLVVHVPSGASNPDEFVSAHAGEEREPDKARRDLNGGERLDQEFR